MILKEWDGPVKKEGKCFLVTDNDLEYFLKRTNPITPLAVTM